MATKATELLRMDVRCEPAAPAAVRGAMTSLRGLGWALGDAMLVASELVTLVVARSSPDAGQWLDVRIGRTADVITVAVRDPRPGTAQETESEADDLAGLGRLIVEQLSRRWGSEREGGYRVWAEIPLGEQRTPRGRGIS